MDDLFRAAIAQDKLHVAKEFVDFSAAFLELDGGGDFEKRLSDTDGPCFWLVRFRDRDKPRQS